jgi:acyl-CoA synthetase (NDP forming)/RimJ/RimL family protein N-acetyltransferase
MTDPGTSGPVPTGAEAGLFALLTDGSTALIRPAGPPDFAAVREMHAALSPDNLYLRFFSMSPLSAEREARRICREPDADHGALLAWLGDRLVGVASYEPDGTDGSAEIAFAVPDDMHRRGVATLLLEHLVTMARLRGLTAFTASALLANSAMLRVFADAGLPSQRRVAEGVAELTFPLPGPAAGPALERYLSSVAGRESRADVASLRHLLAPRSVAVIGAGLEPASPGRAILHSLVAGRFTGKLYAVDPQARHLEGVPVVASVPDLPEPADLAIITGPAAAVPAAAAACGQRGLKALVVISAGLGAAGADLLAVCRRYGMRLVGPASLGIAVPGIGLDATFAAAPAAPGVAGVVVQSGGLGFALVQHLSRLGIGVSSFAALGEKYDVSSNDMLMWWEQDELTRLAVLSVESFGSPRTFARTARRVARRMPVLTVLASQPARGHNGGGPYPAGAAVPLATQEALFGQAGVIAARSLGELIEAAALLACQPRPAGPRVAIVSNAGGAGALAAAACGEHGLIVAALSAATRRRLRGLLPAGAQVTGPVDTTSAVTAQAFRACLEQAALDEGVDAVLAVAVPTAMSDLRGAITGASVATPMATALLGQPESVTLLRREAGSEPRAEAAAGPSPDGGPASAPQGRTGGPPAISGWPAYADPEGAARALGHAARYQAWLDRPDSPVPDLPGLRVPAARELIAGFLASQPDGGWLPAGLAMQLLSCYEIPVAVSVPAAAGEPAAAAGDRAAEVLVSVVQEPVFGPLVMLAQDGTERGGPGARPAALAPLTPADAGRLIGELRAAPLRDDSGAALPADPGAPEPRPGAAAGPGTLAGLLLRVSRLADDLPEVAELEFVAGRLDGARIGGVRARVIPALARDRLLRRLR